LKSIFIFARKVKRKDEFEFVFRFQGGWRFQVSGVRCQVSGVRRKKHRS